MVILFYYEKKSGNKFFDELKIIGMDGYDGINYWKTIFDFWITLA
jgi:hypothetical protein